MNPEFKNLTGVVYNRRIPSDSEAIRMKLIQKELNEKKIKIEIGSYDIYKTKGKNCEKQRKKSVLESRNGVYKSKEKNEAKGKILSVYEYRERFSS